MPTIRYTCRNCGTKHTRWVDMCDNCGWPRGKPTRRK